MTECQTTCRLELVFLTGFAHFLDLRESVCICPVTFDEDISLKAPNNKICYHDIWVNFYRIGWSICHDQIIKNVDEIEQKT